MKRGGPRGKAVGTATFLFTDIVGSSGMFEALGDEVSERLIRGHLRELRDLVGSFEGEVVKGLGDGIMATFGSVVRALDCAVAMQHRIAEMGEAAPRETALRVGIHAGEAVWDGDDYYGLPVWIARRLCEQAAGGQILCSDVVRNLLGARRDHQLEPRGELQLKGIEQPVRAWEIGWRDSRPVAPVARRRLIATAGAGVAMAGIAAAMWLISAGGGTERPSPPPKRSGESVRPETVSGVDADLVSLRRNGITWGDSDSFAPSVSDRGRIVAFRSAAALDPSDVNGFSDIYVFDRKKRTLVHVTAAADGPSFAPSISSDGSLVAFESDATNLVEGDVNGRRDVFVWERATGAFSVASVHSRGDLSEGDSSGADMADAPASVVFSSEAGNLSLYRDENGVSDVFVRDLGTARTNRLSAGPESQDADGASHSASITPDARYVAFLSEATNLGEGRRARRQGTGVYLLSRGARSMSRLSAPDEKVSAPEVGAGPIVVFVAGGDAVAWTPSGRRVLARGADEVAVSGDGRTVAWVDDGDLHVAPAAEPGDARNLTPQIDAPAAQIALSSDGSHVVFQTEVRALYPEETSGVLGIFVVRVPR